MKVKSESEVVQSCPTLRDPMDYSLQGSSIHEIFQARVLEWGAITFSGEIPRVVKFLGTESKIVAARSWAGGHRMESHLNGIEFNFVR